MEKVYSRSAVLKVIEKYTEELDGTLDIIDENSVLLDFGLAVLSAPDHKYIIIKDKYLSEWSSAYTVKQYKKLPKKYQELITNL